MAKDSPQRSSSGSVSATQQAAAQDAELRHIYAACVLECLTHWSERDAILVGLSDAYEHLRSIVPDPEAEWVTRRGSSVGGSVNGGSPPASYSPLASFSNGRPPGGAGSSIEPVVAVPDGVAGEDSAWVPPDTFERKSTKFWAHPAVIPALQAEIIRHLPILVFGRRRSDRMTSGDIANGVLRPLSQQRTAAGSSLSSVYYDNVNSFSTYQDRLRREHGAQLVRVRWYGHRNAAAPGQRLWVERKTHRERWTGESSVKERAEVQQQHLAAFAAGSLDVPELQGGSKRAELLRAAQTFLTTTAQEPVLRTSCQRIAFQDSRSNMIRVSIDTDLKFTKEVAAARGSDWCHSDSALLGPENSQRFPYAIVEIKLQGIGQPAWIQRLVVSGLLLEVPMFSKYLHAAALLFPRQVHSVGVPYWFLPDEGGTMTPATYEEMADTADVYLKDATPWAFPRNFRAPPQKTTFGARLLSFLRGSAPDCSPAAAAAGSKGGRYQFSGGPPAPAYGSAAAGTAAAGSAGGAVFSQLPLAAGPPEGSPHDSRRQVAAGAPSCGPSETAVTQPPTHAAGRYAEGAALLVPGDSSGWLPEPAVVQQCCLHGSSSSIGDGGGGSRSDDGRLTASRLSCMAAGGGVQHPRQQQSEVGSAAGHRRSVSAGSGVASPPALPAWPFRGMLSNPHTAPVANGASGSSTAGGDMVSLQLGGSGGTGSTSSGCGAASISSLAVNPGSLAASAPEHTSIDMQPVEARNMQPADGTPHASAAAAAAAAALATGPGDIEEGRPRAGGMMAAPSRGSKRGIRRWAGKLRRGGGSSGGGGGDSWRSARVAKERSQALVRTRVEPKTFFANERTFLQWLNISVLIMLMALSLLGGSTLTGSGGGSGSGSTIIGSKASQIAGMLIAPVAFVFILYALFMYKKRTIQILRRQNVRYDDQRGPVLLVFLLACALIASTTITAKAAFSTF